MENLKVLQQRYQMEDEYYKCRFSTLFHARDLKEGKHVLIRKKREVPPGIEPAFEREIDIQILREGEMLSGFRHQNLPRVLDTVRDKGEIFLVMEHFKGQTMEEFIRDVGLPLDERILNRWLKQLFSVLGYLHTQKLPVVLRDFRHDSIVICSYGVLKLVEFGLAAVMDPERQESPFDGVGDEHFTSPEQLMKAPPHPRQDLYSLGAVLYYKATGERPPKSLERLQGKSAEVRPRELNPALTPEMDALITSLMEVDPEKRISGILGSGAQAGIGGELLQSYMEVFSGTKVSSLDLSDNASGRIFEARDDFRQESSGANDKTDRDEKEIRKKTKWKDLLVLPRWFSKKESMNLSSAPSEPTEDELSSFPFIDLSTLQLERQTGKLLPEAISRSIQGICIGRRSSSVISVAVKDPTQVHIYDHIGYATQNTLRPVLMRADSLMIDLARDYIYRDTDASTGKSWLEWLQQKKYEADSLDMKSTVEETEIFKDEIKGPVIEAVDRLIKEAISIGASDIHLETYETEMRVRYRIDGILHNIETFSPRIAGAIIKRLKIISGMDIAQDRVTQGGRISVKVREREFDIRVSLVPVSTGENMVLRLLNKGAFEFTLSDLGFAPESEKRYRKLLSSPYGMILVSGPTGSGKSTSLYASLSEINRPDRKLLTIEDPIEYEMLGITQVQVNMSPQENEKKVTFARALREFLRHDPDVILVGEIRDSETAAISIQAALTGHLLLSTIHTNDSVGIIARLEDMGIEPFLISSTLLGGVAQRLVRRICQNCREEIQPSPEVLEWFARENISKYRVCRGKGCLNCRGTGYRGRVALYEILEITREIRSLIGSRADGSVILEKAKNGGMQTLFQDGLNKVAESLIGVDEVVRVTMTGE